VAVLEAEGDALPPAASACRSNDTSIVPVTNTARNAETPAITARRCNDHSLALDPQPGRV
jgi:hypothetical protein